MCMLPTVVLEHGWMDGSQTEVREGGIEKQRNRCAHLAEAERGFYLLPSAWHVLNNLLQGSQMSPEERYIWLS